MPSKQRRVVPTLRGSGHKPDCPKCGHGRHVLRVWFGGVKNWACTEHYRIPSTRLKEQTFKDRLLHKAPEQESFSIQELFPNRRARRA